jgi:thiol-disulfide isomerase/thioredoxin
MRFSLLIVVLLIMQLSSFSQITYLTLQDPKHPENEMLVGGITRQVIENNSSCKWFLTGFKSYDPGTHAFKLSDPDADIHLVIFAGTWCEDSQVILPGLYKWASAEGFPENRISLFGVDRDKKTVGDLAGAFGITNVPTIIVMKGGKEQGRVVEYGKTGRWEEELSAIFR